MNKEEGWVVTNPDTPHKGRLVRHGYFKDHGIGVIKAEIAFQYVGAAGISPVTGFLVSFAMTGDIPVANGLLLWVGGPPDQRPEKPSSEP